MGISAVDVFAQGIIGGLGGAAQGAYTSALEEQKRETEAIREQRLSALRTQEYAANRATDARITQQQQDQERAKSADFYARTEASAPGKTIKNQATATYETEDGEPGTSASDTVTTKEPPTRREIADYRAGEAKKSGNEKLIAQTYTEAKDIRAEDEQTRKNRDEDRRMRATEAAAAAKQRELDIKDRDAATRERRIDAMIAGLIGGKKSDLAERKFDEKKWSDAKKELNSNLVVDDGMGGKAAPDFAARSAANSAMNRIYQAGDVDPGDAANLVGDITQRVAAQARAAAKGDNAKYTKFVQAGVEVELEKALGGGRRTSAAPATPAAPAASAPAAARAPGIIDSVRSTVAPGDEYLAKATPDQLWKAIEDPRTKPYAIQELRRRGLLAPEDTSSAPGDSRFGPA
jgi:hypothetical protein